MDAAEFTSDAPGQLVRIPDGFAFIPHGLPPNLTVSREMLTAVESARGALGEFVGQARLVQNIDLIMAPFSRREAVLRGR